MSDTVIGFLNGGLLGVEGLLFVQRIECEGRMIGAEGVDVAYRHGSEEYAPA